MAAPTVLRQRNADALQRAEAASEALAESFPELSERAQALKDAQAGPQRRDYLHTESARLVALADLLEAVAEEVGAKDPEYDFSPIVGDHANEELHKAGYNKPDDVHDASDEELLAVDGVGRTKLERLRKDLEK